MWKIFYKNNVEKNSAIIDIDNWRLSAFEIINNEVKKYFARKITTYFDNLMIFNAKEGMHENLMVSLSTAEKELDNLSVLFPEVRCFWFFDEETLFLITQNLPEIEDVSPSCGFGFSLFNGKAELFSGNISKLRGLSWEGLVFNIEISTFSNNWIKFAPSLEERALLQTKNIIFNNLSKKGTFSLLDKINLEDKLETLPQFAEVYAKVIKIMPKIASSLDDEWRATVESGEYDVSAIKKKAKIKTR